ncbi:type I polyketide synthase [Tumebacillus flagellatus]|uniref:Uncharacterized protein n=1 Tax=Tumebacillus flagellatus TaxID=1157490 RepID=A0A074MB62_9BACL|nr:polyketide synthase [Tumebacillus flagellatus]KEO83162.1 hypothetical protein EL26_11885 [Tumebacillus flagellatus]
MLRLSDLNLDELPDFDLEEFEAQEAPDAEEPNPREIAVIGMALRFPLADNPREFWENIRSGVDATRPFPAARKEFADAFLESRGTPQPILYLDGGFLDDVAGFDAKFFRMTPAEARLMSPEQRLFLECAWEALEDAGYGGARAVGSRTGVFAGHIGDLGGFTYRQLLDEAEPDPALRAAAVPGNLASIISSRISYLLDLKGPAMLIDTACSSSLVAIHQACLALRNGDCEMALAGGVRLNLIPQDKPEEHVGMESSDGKTRTFDAASDGTAMGEGVGVVLLKPLAQALQDGDPVYAVIKGTAINQDGLSAGITFPNAHAQTDVLLRAWKDAGIDPTTISCIEAHGTGTKIGDPIEIDGLSRAFERYTDQKQFVAIGSVKSNIGHSYQSAGIAGLIKSALALRHRELPPTLHFQEPNRRVKFMETPFYVNARLQAWPAGATPRRTGISSFGFSGTNAHVVLEEAPSLEKTEESGKTQLLLLSAGSWAALRELVCRYVTFLPNAEGSFEEICYSAAVGRGHFSHRLAVVAVDKLDAAARLQERLEEAQLPESTATATAEFALAQEELESAVREHLHEWQAGGYEDETQLHVLAELYMQGAELDAARLYPRKRFQIVHVPTTPFDRKPCWLPMPTASTGRRVPAQTNSLAQPTQPSGRPASSQPVKLAGRADGAYTDIERQLAGLIRDVLGVEELNIHDSLYELGGNSLLLGVIHGKLQALYPGILEMADLFAHPSVAQLANFLTQKGTLSATPIAAAAPQEPTPSAISEKNDADDLYRLLDNIENGTLTIDQALETLTAKGGRSWNNC